MRHSQIFIDRMTGSLHVTPSWPPVPSVGDHWVKPASNQDSYRGRHLERKVLDIKGWNLTYEDQNGKIKTTNADVFRRWTDDCRAVPKKLRTHIVRRKDCCECPKGAPSSVCRKCYGEGEMVVIQRKKRPPKHTEGAYVWHRKQAV